MNEYDLFYDNHEFADVDTVFPPDLTQIGAVLIKKGAALTSGPYGCMDTYRMSDKQYQLAKMLIREPFHNLQLEETHDPNVDYSELREWLLNQGDSKQST
jgi:hypothetical protein